LGMGASWEGICGLTFASPANTARSWGVIEGGTFMANPAASCNGEAADIREI